MMPVLQRGKLRQKEAKHLAQGHSDSEAGLKLRVLPGAVCVATKPWASGPPLHLLADQAENAIINNHPYPLSLF